MKTVRTIDQKEITGIIDYLSHNILHSKLYNGSFNPQIIVTLAKGGFIPARILAKSLNINTILSYGISFYDKNNVKTENPIVYQDLTSCKEFLQDKNILIVDDIADSGHSINNCVKHLMCDIGVKNENIRTCCIFKKDRSSVTPHYYFDSVDYDTWINFPWE